MVFREIDKDTPVPLYYQISQQIRDQIEAGELKPGDRLPTEKELQEEFEVSRATVRRAISSRDSGSQWCMVLWDKSRADKRACCGLSLLEGFRQDLG